MLQKGAKRKNVIILLSSILLISFALMTIDVRRGQESIFFESLIHWVISPIQNLYSKTVTSISDVIDHYIFLAGVSQENERLKKEIESLVKQSNDLLEQLFLEQRVSRLIEYQEASQRTSLVASVIGRDATQWSKVVFINKGTEHGVQENLAVVSDAGIIGHVIQSSEQSSKVLLIVDSRSAVDALFQETRVQGVVVGTGKETCDMNFVPITAEVSVGDKVLSSGMGGIFPKGLVAGKVSSVIKKKEGLFQEIKIRPSADLSRLEEVLVLLPNT